MEDKRSQLIELAKQYQFKFKPGPPNLLAIEYHVRKCLAKGQEPIEIKPVKKRTRDIGYYLYLKDLAVENGFTFKKLPLMKTLIAYLNENDIPYQVQFKFMRRDFRTYQECTTNYQLLLFRAKELGYEKITKGRPSLKSLNEFLSQFSL